MDSLYHYTNKQGYDAICAGGYIESSDGKYGRGVYLTTLNPHDHDKDTLAKKNYSSGARMNRAKGKLDYYIEVKLAETQVREVRDGVWKYGRGEPLSLSSLEWKGGKNSSWSARDIVGGFVMGGLIVGALALSAWADRKQKKSEKK